MEGKRSLKVLDVGGNKNTHKQATHIIDILAKPKGCKLKYTQMDVCSGKWPFKNKEFDYVYCSNLLEDIKDPVFVCKEMMRVGKAGRIVVPNVITECRLGVDTWPKSYMYAGFIHHRWLCLVKLNEITFLPKTPMTHIYDWTGHLSYEYIKNNFFMVLDWIDKFKVTEISFMSWDVLYNTLRDHIGVDPKNKGESKDG